MYDNVMCYGIREPIFFCFAFQRVFVLSVSTVLIFVIGLSSVPNLLARIQYLEAYTTELEEGQQQIFRVLGRWVDEADLCFFVVVVFLVRDCSIERSMVHL